eukprot:149128-Heterocapsa_arctica.AAC.1
METKREQVSNNKYRRAGLGSRTPLAGAAGWLAAWLPRSPFPPAWPDLLASGGRTFASANRLTHAQ